MACMGPDKDGAYERAEKAFIEISDFLNKKYFIDISKEQSCGIFNKDFNKHRKEFKESLKEIFWDDACEGF